jgi:hypothetical protein
MSAGFAGISLHLDSLGEAFGYPDNLYDPAYHQVLDRFQRLCDRFSVRGSVYIIGRDLQERAHRSRLRWLANKGHEIGNHSWTHYINLGSLSTEEIRFEVRASHFRIADCIGYEPRGFVAPAWSWSPRLAKVLISCGYDYDASLFPTPLLYAFLAKNALNHLNQPKKLRRVLDRKDWLEPIRAKKDPFLFQGQSGDLLMLPMPVAKGPLGMAVWHTTGFVFGWKKHFELMETAMADRRYFNYVIHPADLLGEEDVPSGFPHSLERLNGSWTEKYARMEDCFRVLAESGKRLVTIDEMAAEARHALVPDAVPAYAEVR